MASNVVQKLLGCCVFACLILLNVRAERNNNPPFSQKLGHAESAAQCLGQAVQLECNAMQCLGGQMGPGTTYEQLMELMTILNEQ